MLCPTRNDLAITLPKSVSLNPSVRVAAGTDVDLTTFLSHYNGSRTMRRSPLFSFSFVRSLSFHRNAYCWVLLAAIALPVGPVSAETTGGQSDDGAPTSTVADPYLVFVAEESAHLRCGPGGEYYRTDPLRHGQELEVYVEYPDGWLGVRPTADSFCWIPADAVKIIESKNAKSGQKADAIDAEIIENKTKAWIGTNLGSARRSRWQVQLGEGEIVTILGRSERDGPDGPLAWYRIVPPSGEFRWIHRDQVVTTAEELVAGVKLATTDEPIEFLPAGPTSVATKDSGSERVNEIASIRRIDEIEKHIDERQRSRFDRLRDGVMDTEIAAAASTGNGSSHDHAGEHQMRSFSQRVTDGLASLINGQPSNLNEAQPVTGSSSRRAPELVPIGSGLAANNGSPTPAISPLPVAPSMSVPPSAPELGPLASSAVAADAKTVAATAHPEFRASESQVAIMSAPRLVTSADALPPAPHHFAGQGLQPTKLRTITSTQIEGVQRSVAESTPESLPLIMSTLMARGASAPEIRIVADAAQRFSLNDLAQRARDYEALARRRDGDTLVANSSSSYPPLIAASPTTPMPSTPASTTFNNENSFVSRTGGEVFGGSPAAVVPASHMGGITYPNPNQVIQANTAGVMDSPRATEQTGTLVEVYSADPNRPPFAITDRGGRTLAYVTPAPGVEIRNHLGSEVRLQGETGFLQGLDTPHVLATHAERLLR